MKLKTCLIGSAAALALATSGASLARGARDAIPYSTPPGITLIDVTKIYASTQDQFLWRRLGDENGKALYTFDQDTKPNKSSCVEACAKEFSPFLAPKGARPSGDFSLIKRTDTKDLQWAYQGKPLYRYAAGEDPPGAPLAGDTATLDRENPDWYNPGSSFYTPKAGFRRAAFTPEKTVIVPPGIALQTLAVANGFGLVDSMTHMTIYAVPDKKKLSREWAPVYAAELASPVKDFSIAIREDGTHQWAYKGRALYTFSGDYSPGDVNGMYAAEAVPVALIYRNFLPESIAINVLPGRGPLMMTKEGLSVYTQARYNLQYGGRETRTGYSIPYNTAKAVGTRGCVETCTQTWKPVQAPENAVGQGFWEVATRNDGTKQWAYKGSPLYTYVADKKPGDIQGNNRHEVLYGDPQGKINLEVAIGTSTLGLNRSMQAGAGFYWHLAGLFY